MKRPATKRPAAKVGGDGEPSGEPSGTVSLTAEAVKDHNKFCEEAQSMTVEQFELALNKPDSKASMRLWKAFETSRKMSGEEEKYKEATKEGVGALRKKRKLLFGWAVGGKKQETASRMLGASEPCQGTDCPQHMADTSPSSEPLG